MKHKSLREQHFERRREAVEKVKEIKKRDPRLGAAAEALLFRTEKLLKGEKDAV